MPYTGIKLARFLNFECNIFNVNNCVLQYSSAVTVTSRSALIFGQQKFFIGQHIWSISIGGICVD